MAGQLLGWSFAVVLGVAVAVGVAAGGGWEPVMWQAAGAKQWQRVAGQIIGWLSAVAVCGHWEM